jgi:uncharacterized protein YndB with AHSA1/START domain
MAGESHGYALRVDLQADIAEVWQALIEPSLLRRWCAQSAQVDARAGGSYGLLLPGDLKREAHVDIFAPPRRLRLIYMPMLGLPSEQPVLVDDFLLDSVTELPSEPARPGTVLRLLGSGFLDAPPWDGLYVHLRGYWEQALLELKALLEQQSAAPKSARQQTQRGLAE